MELSAFTYSLPFAKHFRSTITNIKERTGLILLLEFDGNIALGEAAPLPGFSPESLEKVMNQYLQKRDDILQFHKTVQSLSATADFLRVQNLSPSLAFAVVTLTFHYLSHTNWLEINEGMLSNDPEPPLVNGIIPLTDDLSDALNTAEELISEGITTLKIKVGKDFESDTTLLEKLRARFPSINIRIDANGSWSIDDAIEKLGALGKFELEYCEEPISEPSPEKLKKLKQTVGIPLAMDESLLKLSEPSSVFPHMDALIIKPMMYGSFTKIFATKELADDHDIKTVFSTSLESAIGRRMTALLAGSIGSPVAHGLDTGRLLQADFTKSGTYIRNGRFIIPSLEELAESFQYNRSIAGLERIE